jgi:hypothetical protein
VYRDDSELWSEDVLENHYEEALERVAKVHQRSRTDANGCWVLPTLKRPKTRFLSRQVASARFVYCVTNRAVLREDVVIRHRCHNELCVNPSHLIEGSAADNKLDDWDNWANGVDYDLL